MAAMDHFDHGPIACACVACAKTRGLLTAWADCAHGSEERRLVILEHDFIVVLPTSHSFAPLAVLGEGHTDPARRNAVSLQPECGVHSTLVVARWRRHNCRN